MPKHHAKTLKRINEGKHALNFGIRWKWLLYAPAVLSIGKESPVPIFIGGWWAPKLFWKYWLGEEPYHSRE
jgi:hypothetical protein